MVVCCEYIWLDADQNPRSKTRVVAGPIGNLRDLPKWNYDGSSTGQATTADSEVELCPVYMCPDPFREPGDLLVLCDTWARGPESGMFVVPLPGNTRDTCESILSKHEAEQPMFGFEQEFFMLDLKTMLPLGFAADGTTAPQGQYYCGVGAGSAHGRRFVEQVLRLALNAGLSITGANYEVAPGQAELQICTTGITAADELVMLRYILLRAGEEHRIHITFHPKPVKGDWNGSGCHINFSTLAMREDTPAAFGVIGTAIDRLAETHAEHIAIYGPGNEKRLTGIHETSSPTKFTWGVGDRSASVRVPTQTQKDGFGYLEDRRPGANVDPYLAAGKLVDTICGSSAKKSE
jgi:glutamine synthetase